MSGTLVVEQPNYVPWIGYFDLIRQSDVWVWYDDVQYTKRDWRNRNLVAGDGAPIWLTIPVKTKDRFAQAICETEIDYQLPWVRRHLQTLRHCYARAPFFETVRHLVANALEAEHKLLADLTIALNESICAAMNIAPRFLRSSQMAVTGDRQERLLSLCRRVGAAAYLSGPAARDYLDPRTFERAGIELLYIVYDYPPYERGGRPFVPLLSILDALAWLGPEGTTSYIAACSRSEPAEVLC